MRTAFMLCAVVLASLVLLAGVPSGPGAAASPVRQVESWVLYDDFNAGPIDPNKWFGGESTAWGAENRRIAGTGLLRMRYTSYAGNASDTGWWSSSLRLNLMNPAAITQIQAMSRVQNWGMIGCPGNTSIQTRTRARIFGSFFNAGTPVQGSDLDNVYASIMLRRLVTSTDGDNVFRVEADAYRCTDAQCSTSTSAGWLTLGYTTVGTLVTISVVWDPANDRFIYQFGTNPPVNQPYTWSDTNPPSYVFKRLEVHHIVPNCSTPPRPMAFMSARFDDVYINASAVSALARGARDRGSSPPYEGPAR